MKTSSVKLYRPTQTRLDLLVLAAWRRGLALLELLVETWIEARELQRTAHRRYPFADW